MERIRDFHDYAQYKFTFTFTYRTARIQSLNDDGNSHLRSVRCCMALFSSCRRTSIPHTMAEPSSSPACSGNSSRRPRRLRRADWSPTSRVSCSSIRTVCRMPSAGPFPNILFHADSLGTAAPRLSTHSIEENNTYCAHVKLRLRKTSNQSTWHFGHKNFFLFLINFIHHQMVHKKNLTKTN